MPSATIIIPTLNEEDNIDPLLAKLSKISVNNCQLTILFVDDQSQDKTVPKIKHWQKKFSNISVLERKGPADLTQSVLAGVAHARSDYIVVMDADMSHPPDKIAALLQPLLAGTHDVAVGSRYISAGAIADWPARRRFLSWFGSLPARVLTDVKDPTSGFFACKKTCFDTIGTNARGYKILLELLAGGLDKLRSIEIPITFTDRTLGKSKLSGKQLVQYSQRLVELGGGKLNTSVTTRFVFVGLSGAIIDALFFQFFLSKGWSISSSHITSFFIAAAGNYFFNSIWSFKYCHASLHSWLTRAIKYIYFGMIALTIRGGVLAVFINLFNIAPTLAIFPAIVMAALVNYFGAAFIVFPDNKTPGRLSSINWRILALATMAFTLLVRFLYSGTAELIPDEAYYWNYKQHLNLGYLDHPPMIAWLIWLSTSVFGDNEFGVRFFALLCGGMTLFFIFRLTALLFDKTSAYIALLFVSTLPFTVATGFLATTDALQTALWAACLYFLAGLINTSRAGAWLGVGLCIGLGLLSKYTMALLAVAVGVWLCVNRTMRVWWRRPILYLAGIIALILFSPALYWNYQNGWSSFLFQTSRRLHQAEVFSTHYILLHLLILLSPVGVALLWHVFKNLNPLLQSKIKQLSLRAVYAGFFLSFTLVPLCVFVYFSLSHYPRFHWSAPIWLAAIPLMAYAFSPTSAIFSYRLMRPLMLYSMALLCLLYGGLLHFAALGLPVKIDTDVTDHYFWKQVAKEIHTVEQNIIAETGQRPIIIGLSKWSVASALRFYDADGQVGNITARNAIGRSATMYEQWSDLTAWQDHPVIFVTLDYNDLNSNAVKKHARQLQPVISQTIYRNNNKIRSLHYRTARHYTL